MIYQRIEPSREINHLIKEYWIFENDDPLIYRQKIIPDGYFEIIFHYGDPYRVNLHGNWELQSKALFAGQIDRHFFLENTGRSAMLGIKLKPSAVYELFQKDMSLFTNRVVELKTVKELPINFFENICLSSKNVADRISALEQWIQSMAKAEPWHGYSRVAEVVNKINKSNGTLNFQNIAEEVFISKRQLERDFKKSVGLTLKKFARIIRFNQIFEIMKKGDIRWVDLALQSGYYDQSHFIKDFKEFTGEEPSMYGFEEYNLANFFLNKN